jgi:hypothetical protein
VWDELTPLPYEVWMERQLKILQKCNILFRMSGNSPGADREVDLARKIGIPIYYTISQLKKNASYHTLEIQI